ncbi:methyl-accepting chemotaxis protein [Terribacillus saccharophilus]|uniref:methyl-accepting chemotaxis protein n=1 Tax=Terribacillus saccharophilus TaxID=361277 RepID=UPI002989AC5A|nr:methyl-accepting chemotaxis protein [Terribacillus saccharophilus]MCM3225721.1 methyl-accepting chemotaxis protein [Terribacillus saccharophilus]
MRVINRLKLGTKINLLVLTVVLLFAGIISYVVMNNMTHGMKGIALEKAKSDLQLAEEYINAVHPGSWEIRDGVLYKGETKMNDNFDLVDRIGELTGDTVTIFQQDTRVATNVMTDGERAVGTQVSAAVKQAVIDNEETYYGEAEVVGNSYQTAYSPIKNDEGQVIGIWYVGASDSMVASSIADFTKIFVVVLVLVVVLAIVVVLFFTRGIKKRLSRISQAMHNAGKGDFSYMVEDSSNDEIGQLTMNLSEMRENLSDVMKTIAETSDQVAASSEELTASAEESSKSAELIAASTQTAANGTELTMHHVEDVVASVEHMQKRVKEAQTNSQTIMILSDTASRNSQDGTEAVLAVVKQMNEINNSVTEIGSFVNGLDKKSKEIGTIVNLISDISNQTNLLALNAAIEAARAGEQGKGFAVVADEVRKLAEQSANSTQLIASLISDIQTETDKAVTAMQHGAENVEEGIRKTENVNGSFQSIKQAINQVTNNVQEVSQTIEGVSSGSKNIVEVMDKVKMTARENAESNETNAAASQQQSAAMEEISASSEALSGMAMDLQAALGKFKF